MPNVVKKQLKTQESILDWNNTYRAIPSKFPPIDFFEHLVDPSLMEELYYIESLTNDRLRDEVGEISLVPKEDRVSGTGSSVVMAAFTHINRTSRFSDGTFGVYYAAKSLETAIREKAHHTEIFLSYTNEEPGLCTLRIYQSQKILKPLTDIRGDDFSHLHNPLNYAVSQQFGFEEKNKNTWGIVYNSVRHSGGECVAILRPCAIPVPVIQTKHYQLEWDGTKIVRAIEIGGTVFNF